jgi:biopolymer transport protein ExbD
VHPRGGHSHRRWRLSGHKKAHVDTVRNDINVTPLVDVMLVLLIIFMLMVLLMGRGHDVRLPQANNFSQEKDKMQPVVSIDVDGMLWVEKQKLGPINPGTLKDMDAAVQALWAKKPDGAGQVYIKADYEVQYATVYPVLEHIARGELGVTSIDLAIAKESGGK